MAGIADFLAARPPAQQLLNDMEAAHDGALAARAGAEDHADAAQGSAARAESLAESTAIVAVYPDRATADSALSGLANGDVVEVSRDEDNGDVRWRYTVVAGAFALGVPLPVLAADTLRPSEYVITDAALPVRVRPDGVTRRPEWLDPAFFTSDAAARTASLKNAVADLSPGDTLVLTGDLTLKADDDANQGTGGYDCYGQGLLVDTPGVTVDLSGATLRASSSTTGEYAVVVVTGDDVTLIRPTIIGDRAFGGAPSEFGAGIVVTSGAKNCRIVSPTISNCRGDGIFVGVSGPQPGGGTGTYADAPVNTTILDPQISNCDRQGFSIVSALGGAILGGYVRDIGRIAPGYAVDFEPNALGPNVGWTVLGLRSSGCAGSVNFNSKNDDITLLGLVCEDETGVTYGGTCRRIVARGCSLGDPRRTYSADDRPQLYAPFPVEMEDCVVESSDFWGGDVFTADLRLADTETNGRPGLTLRRVGIHGLAGQPRLGNLTGGSDKLALEDVLFTVAAGSGRTDADVVEMAARLSGTVEYRYEGDDGRLLKVTHYAGTVVEGDLVYDGIGAGVFASPARTVVRPPAGYNTATVETAAVVLAGGNATVLVPAPASGFPLYTVRGRSGSTTNDRQVRGGFGGFSGSNTIISVENLSSVDMKIAVDYLVP